MEFLLTGRGKNLRKVDLVLNFRYKIKMLLDM